MPPKWVEDTEAEIDFRREKQREIDRVRQQEDRERADNLCQRVLIPMLPRGVEVKKCHTTYLVTGNKYAVEALLDLGDAVEIWVGFVGRITRGKTPRITVEIPLASRFGGWHIPRGERMDKFELAEALLTEYRKGIELRLRESNSLLSRVTPS